MEDFEEDDWDEEDDECLDCGYYYLDCICDFDDEDEDEDNA